MHLASLPDRRAELDPNSRSLNDSTESLTNLDLLDRAAAAAEHLRELGIGPGDVVALKLTNRVEFVVLLFAAWRIGATVTPINPALTAGEVAHQVTDSGTRVMVLEDATTGDEQVPALAVGDLRRTRTRDVEPAQQDPDALALLIYTSGTTGAPKGVMLDHANLEAMVEMGQLALDVGPEDRCLLILPLFHVNGIVVSVLLPLATGASVVIADRFNPRSFFDVVEAERPTYFSGVPTIFALLTALPADVTPDTSSVRFAICGAAPAGADLLVRFEERFGFPLVEAYGLSEGTCGSTINPVGDARAGTVGKAFPGQDVRILRSDGTEAPTGTDGEVAVRGANVMRGYLGRPEETAAVIVDGWLHTGDVGQLDADGYLTLVGRSKDMIIRGGENIYPKEIEDVLTSHPAVLDAAVIGVPDEVWGEVVVAYVEAVSGESPDPELLRKHCADQLSRYKRPTAVHVVTALPRNAVGKITKPALRHAHAKATSPVTSVASAQKVG